MPASSCRWGPASSTAPTCRSAATRSSSSVSPTTSRRPSRSCARRRSNTASTPPRRSFPGNAAVRRKTLHRWMNDLLGDWEQAGVDTFIILTAHGHDPHQEALSTLRTRRARIFTVDAFALDFTGQLEDPDGPMHGSELDTSLLLYVAPALVRMERARDFTLSGKRRTGGSIGKLPAHSPGSVGRPSVATREKGERLYKMIYDRIATRVLGAPVP